MYGVKVGIVCIILILSGFLFGCSHLASQNSIEAGIVIIDVPEIHEAQASPTPNPSILTTLTPTAKTIETLSTVTTKRGGMITVQRVDDVIKSITFSPSQEEMDILSELAQSDPDMTNGELESTYFPELYALKLEQMCEDDEVWSVPVFRKARIKYYDEMRRQNKG